MDVILIRCIIINGLNGIKNIRIELNSRKMTVKLSTTINNIERDVLNLENKQLLLKLYEFMKRIDTSKRYQNNNLKAIIAYSKFLEPSISFHQIKSKVKLFHFWIQR